MSKIPKDNNVPKNREKVFEAETLLAAASSIANAETADAITAALNDAVRPIVKKLSHQGKSPTEAFNLATEIVSKRLRSKGLNPKEVFALARGEKRGSAVKVSDLSKIALALGKQLKINID